MWTNVNSPTLGCESEGGSWEALLSAFAKDAIYKQQVVQCCLFFLIPRLLIPGSSVSRSVCLPQNYVSAAQGRRPHHL